MINVGIIGAGRIGKVHCESIMRYVKGATVKAIADPFLKEDTVEWAKSLGVKEFFTDYKKILADKAIQAVLICSSTDTHSPISIDGFFAEDVLARFQRLDGDGHVHMAERGVDNQLQALVLKHCLVVGINDAAGELRLCLVAAFGNQIRDGRDLKLLLHPRSAQCGDMDVSATATLSYYSNS